MGKLYLLCGLPGSGKSTYANHLIKEDNCILHSSDNIRQELGDITDQSKNKKVFKILHKRIKNDLKNNKNVIYDATNINKQLRMDFLNSINNIPCEKICVLIDTPLNVCLEQNLKRNRNVPKDVILKMYKSFQKPTMEEGFDNIIIFKGKINKQDRQLNMPLSFSKQLNNALNLYNKNSNNHISKDVSSKHDDYIQ